MVAVGVAFGAAWRTSVQQSRCMTISVRRRLRVAQSRMGMPIRNAYHRAGLFAALATEPETRPAMPSDCAAACGESLVRGGGDAETGDEDERERQEPDEQPVRERASDDPAADLGIAVGHLEHRVDRAVAVRAPPAHAPGSAPRAPARPRSGHAHALSASAALQGSSGSGSVTGTLMVLGCAR